MGIWDWISSTTEAAKRNAPDPAAVKGACKTSYDYCSAAIGKIDNAVRVNGIQRLGDYIPSEETRSKIILFTSKFAQNAGRHAIREGYKWVPGGKAVAEIISETMNDVKYEKRKQEMEAMKEMIGGGKSSASKNLLDVELGCEKKGSFANAATANQTPEDVLRIFMIREFMGNRFADDLILSQIKHGIKSK